MINYVKTIKKKKKILIIFLLFICNILIIQINILFVKLLVTALKPVIIYSTVGILDGLGRKIEAITQLKHLSHTYL